jgi:uncharacterized protein (DUF1800 family)
MSRLHPLLEPFVATAADPFDAVKAAHLLQRAGFGGTLEEIEDVCALGPEKAVEQLLDFPDAGADDVGTDTPDLSGIDGYPRTFAERRKLFEGKTADERQMRVQQLQRADREAVRATAVWWVNRMALGPFPLQEKLTLYWHGHFTTSARDERSAWLMWQQNETLRRNAAGNFEKFVKSISRDPAMLDYLNNQQNRKGKPNENYARELMELFTLGIGAYTEADIKEAARAFTGWGHDGEAFIFRPSLHDADPKKFFGVQGNFDGDDIIDLILRRKECGNYIASKLFRFFAYDKLENGMENGLGDVLRDRHYEIRPLLYTIFTSKAFYSPASIGTQIKSPVQLVTSTARQMGLKAPNTGGIAGALEQMGQVPLNPPNVKGWPGGRTWISTSTLFVRFNTAIAMAGKIADRDLIPPDAKDARLVVKHWLCRLIQRPVAEEKEAMLVQAMGGESAKPQAANVRKVIELIVSMPEFQLC